MRDGLPVTLFNTGQGRRFGSQFTMKIRDKLLLGFGLYILLAVILGFFAYKELRTINNRLILVETADDITNTILEVRRYEKNFLLYKDEHQPSRKLKEYLAKLKEDIGNIEAEIISEIGSGSYEALSRDIAEFERLIDAIADNFSSQDGAGKPGPRGRAGGSSVRCPGS